MYHTIEFTRHLVIDLEVSPKQPLSRLRLRKGDRLPAQLRPHVVETASGPVEVADLFFADGTTSRSVPFSDFTFVE